MKRNFGICSVLLLIVFNVFGINSREFEFGPCFLSVLEPCSNNTIQFYLYTDNETEPIILDNNSPILPTDYNETTSINYKMIIHGYGGHADVGGFKSIRNGRLKNRQKN
jgi:hypothetical protein